jgi:hypothetical protein
VEFSSYLLGWISYKPMYFLRVCVYVGMGKWGSGGTYLCRKIKHMTGCYRPLYGLLNTLCRLEYHTK